MAKKEENYRPNPLDGKIPDGSSNWDVLKIFGDNDTFRRTEISSFGNCTDRKICSKLNFEATFYLEKRPLGVQKRLCLAQLMTIIVTR